MKAHEKIDYENLYELPEENKPYHFNPTKMITYLLALLFYFLVAPLVTQYIVEPVLVKIVHEPADITLAPTAILNKVAYDEFGVGLIESSDYLKHIESYTFKDGTTSVKTIGLFAIKKGEDGSLDIIKVLKDSTITYPNHTLYYVTINYLNENAFVVDVDGYISNVDLNALLTNQTTQFNNGKDIHFYYQLNYFKNGDFFNNPMYMPVSIAKSSFNALYNLVAYIVLAIPLFIYFRKEFFADYHGFKKEPDRAATIFNYTSYTIIAGVAFNLIATLLSLVIIIPSAPSVNQSSINAMMQSNYALLMIVAAVILGPFAEEFIFRRAIFSIIQRPIISIIISSLLFAYIHISSEPSFKYMIIKGIPYLGGGLIFGYIYTKNKNNLFLVYSVHALYNLLSLLLPLIL